MSSGDGPQNNQQRGVQPADDLVTYANGDFSARDQTQSDFALSDGCDVTVSRLGLNGSGSGDDWAYYGSATDEDGDTASGFAVASTSCNAGDQTCEWISGSSARHPLIGSNAYRYSNGRMEQIGMSWLKHSFCAVSEPTCFAQVDAPTCFGTSCSTLGIGCADTYWATLNGDPGLGPRRDVNPQGTLSNGGSHSHPQSASSSSAALSGKLQVKHQDILADNNARFAIEVHYVTHDEPQENRNNNASWREVDINTNNIIGIGSGQASVHFMEPAVKAWEDYALDDGNTSVRVRGVDFAPAGASLGGHINVGHGVWDLGDGTYRYDYIVHNMNLTDNVASFAVPIPDGVNVSDIYFHDVHHHGEAYDKTDWTSTLAGGFLKWEMVVPPPPADPANANSIRWGTAYTFSFVADTPSKTATVEIGTQDNPQVKEHVAIAPDDAPTGDPCPADVNGDNVVDVTDLVAVILDWGTDGSANGGDVDGSGLVDVTDLVQVIIDWGTCPGA